MQMKREPEAEAEKPSGNVEGAETPGCSQQPARGRARGGQCWSCCASVCLILAWSRGGTSPWEGVTEVALGSSSALPSCCGRCGCAV